MLDYLILEKKPNIQIENETAKDLLYKTVDLEKNYSGGFLEVNEYYIARPDLISLACYGTDKYGDIICKVNGISNPFELNQGMVLFIPTYESINNILDVKVNSSIKTQKLEDANEIAFILKEGNQKAKNEKRTPANQIVGDKNFIIDKSLGLVFY